MIGTIVTVINDPLRILYVITDRVGHDYELTADNGNSMWFDIRQFDIAYCTNRHWLAA